MNGKPKNGSGKRKGFAYGNPGRPGPMPEEEKAKHSSKNSGRPRGRKNKLKAATYQQEGNHVTYVDDRGRTERVDPYDRGSIEEKRETARAKGAGDLASCVELWSRLVMRGLAYLRRGRSLPEDSAGAILRASENLSNRCGLPVLSEMSVRAAVPAKLINEGKGPGWMDREGNFHPIEPTAVEAVVEDSH